MNQEIENIEKIFQESVIKLKNYINSLLNKINAWNISRPIKLMYISNVKEFYNSEYKKLQNKRTEERIRRKSLEDPVVSSTERQAREAA